MPNYLRLYLPGGTYFFTLVTHHRLPIFNQEDARNIFHEAWMGVKRRYPFDTVAFCLLPDHLHCIWTLPEGEANYSLRWKEIKRMFSYQYRKVLRCGEAQIIKRDRANVWQDRYWEHYIRDEVDLLRHVEYIHYNPVKHGLTKRPIDWQWSSFQRYVRMGFYEADWGESEIKIDIQSRE